MLVPLRIEPLSRAHDRRGFASGNGHVDTQAREHLLTLQEEGLTRAYVAVRPGEAEVLGLYAVNPHMLQVWDAGERWDAVIRQYGLEGLPAAYISLFGVHGPVQRQGIGRRLFADALRRISRAGAAGPLAPLVVLLDPIDARTERFYARFGFTGLPDRPRRMVLPVRAIG